MNKKTAFGSIIAWKRKNSDGKIGYVAGVIIGHDRADVIVCPLAFEPLPYTVKTQFGYVMASKVQTIAYADITKRIGYIRGKELRALRARLHSIFADMIYGKHENETLSRVYTERSTHKNGLDKLVHKVLARPDNDGFFSMLVESLSEDE